MRTDAYVTSATINELCAAWIRDIRASVAPRPHLELDPSRSALLVIDMLRYFSHPAGRSFLPATTAIIPRIQSLVEAWRRLRRPVVFTRHAHRGKEDLGMLGRFFSDYIRLGEPDSELIEELSPIEGEAVLRKTTYDAFLGTELESQLRSHRVEQVVITGVLTHMCCETTARSAFCRGFEVYLPIDALASSSLNRHLGSLFSLADAVGVIMTTAEVLDRCPKTSLS